MFFVGLALKELKINLKNVKTLCYTIVYDPAETTCPDYISVKVLKNLEEELE